MLGKIPMMDDNKLMKLFQNAKRQVGKGHPKALDVLEQIQKEWRERLEKAKHGSYRAAMPEKGMLSAFGYCVGSSGILDKSIRREILMTVFSSDLPVVGSPTYTVEWGEKGSTKRYTKLRKTIFGLISHNRYLNMEQALEHWNDDLHFIDEVIQPMARACT